MGCFGSKLATSTEETTDKIIEAASEALHTLADTGVKVATELAQEAVKGGAAIVNAALEEGKDKLVEEIKDKIGDLATAAASTGLVSKEIATAMTEVVKVQVEAKIEAAQDAAEAKVASLAADASEKVTEVATAADAKVDQAIETAAKKLDDAI